MEAQLESKYVEVKRGKQTCGESGGMIVEHWQKVRDREERKKSIQLIQWLTKR